MSLCVGVSLLCKETAHVEKGIMRSVALSGVLSKEMVSCTEKNGVLPSGFCPRGVPRSAVLIEQCYFYLPLIWIQAQTFRREVVSKRQEEKKPACGELS